MLRLLEPRPLIVATLFLTLAACKPQEKDAHKYIQEGKELLAQGNIDPARIQFKNALQIQPKLTEAYYQLALIDEKRQNWQGVYNNLSEVVRLEPNHVEAHLKLGQLLLIGRNFEKASAEAATVMQLRPDYAGGLTLSAAILFSQDKKAESLEQINRALDKDPAYYDAVTLKASIYLAEHNYSEALAFLQRHIELRPRDVGLQLMKIRTEAASDNQGAAVADYQTLISQYPNDKGLASGFVAMLLSIGRQEQAEGVLRQIIDKDADNVDAKLRLVDLLAPKDEAEAEKTLKQFVEAQPKALPLLTKAADFYETRKRYADAEMMLNRIIGFDKAGRDSLSAKTKLTRIALSQNEVKKAESLIAEVLAADAANPDALLLRAGMRMDNHETDAAIADLRIVLAAQPNSAAAQEMLARAYTQQGAFELAASTRRNALENNPTNIETALPVVVLMLKEGRDLAKAEQILETALKSNRGNPRGLEMLAQVRTAQKNWEGAQAAVAELAKQPGAMAAALFLSAEIFSRQGNYAEAIKEYQQTLAEKPDFTQAIQGIAQAYRAKGDHPQLIAYMTSFIHGNPTAIEAYNALGMAYGAEKKWPDAVKVLQDALVIDPKSASTYATLASVYSAQNKSTDAIATYRKGVAELPDSIPLRMDLAQFYLTHQEVESAIALLAETVEKYPYDDLAANTLSWLLATHRTDRESLERAAKVAERFSTSSNPHLLDTYAWVSLLTGHLDKAVPALKKAVEAAPDSAVFQYHLGVAYYQASNRTESKTALERAIALAKKQGGFPEQGNAEKLLKELSAGAGGNKAE